MDAASGCCLDRFCPVDTISPPASRGIWPGKRRSPHRSILNGGKNSVKLRALGKFGNLVRYYRLFRSAIDQDGGIISSFYFEALFSAQKTGRSDSNRRFPHSPSGLFGSYQFFTRVADQPTEESWQVGTLRAVLGCHGPGHPFLPFRLGQTLKTCGIASNAIFHFQFKNRTWLMESGGEYGYD